MLLSYNKNKCEVNKIVVILSYFVLTIRGAVQFERTSLSNSIRHYEPLNYPKEYLDLGHSRVRRSLKPSEELELNFRAHNRKFELRLKRDVSIFSEGLQFPNEGSFHPSNIYEGKLKDDPSSWVHGFVHDGVFEGRVHCGDGNEFHIESAKQYDHLDHDAFHSVIYNVDDVVHPKRHMCGGAVADHKSWMDGQTNQTSATTQSPYVKYETVNSSEHIMKPDVHHRQRRASFDTKKRECRLLVRADWKFKDYARSSERAMYLITQYVKSVSHIYEGTDFDGDGTPEGILLNIKRIEVIPKSPDCSGVECSFQPENIGVEKFLDISSLQNHDEYCLAYVFSHRDFADGVLGLAWIGDTAGAGGICDRYQPISGSRKSLNTGIVTNLNYGNTMSSKVVEITFAHEIGHNFGSKHDPLSGNCAPGNTGGGNYIMYPRATSGTEKNNYYFSSCSKGYIWPVLQAKSSSCFVPPNEPICGNRIKEDGEDCDCGYIGEESCNKDDCCTPSDTSGGTNPGCKFSVKAKTVVDDKLRCSSSLGLCCDVSKCKPYSNNVKECAEKTECAERTMCSATSYECPTSTRAVNLTICNNGSNVCLSGECTGSICLAEGKEPCQCTAEANFCNICCQDKNISSTCQPMEGKMLISGSPCDNYAGYCDFLSKCRKVDAEGPLSRLKKWLFSSQTIDNILDWMKTYWWACVLIGLGLVLFMAAFIACCSVHTPSSNPNKPPPRHLSLPRTLSRRNRQRTEGPSAPSGGSSGGGGGYQRQPHAGYTPGYPDDKGLPPGYNTAMRDPPSYELR